MKIAAVVACRVGSSRMHSKPLMEIEGKSVLEHVVERLRSANKIDEVVLAISELPENDIFIEYADRIGCPFIRGDENDVLGRLIKAADKVGAEHIVRVTSDCPLIYLDIDRIITHHLSEFADLTFIQKLPLGGIVEVINVKALKKSHEEGENRHRSELVTLYINENKDKFKVEVLDAPEELQRPDIVITVDTPRDLEIMRQIYSYLGKSGHLIRIKDVIEYVDSHPELTNKYDKSERPNARVWD